ncbi:MAG TPA: PIG-L family deacetylase [Candidatus Bipolaricaulis anaerobius]|nr:PIG-L family deacetylase [Candidatus Bipolaricaulis anaerobius]
MKKRQRRVQRMWVMGGILLLPVALGFIPGVPHPFLNLFLWWVPPPPRVEVPAPLPGVERVLVIAPHPDDELLALGGTIAHLTGEGHQVLVVFVTNGDANQAAKQVFTLNPLRRAEDYRALGCRRQKEAVAALRILGVPKTAAIFLGYPDQGLTALGTENWERGNPYPSPYTQANYPFYRNSFSLTAMYCGEDLVADLATILHLFSPTVIYLPHPEDGHPDHRAAAQFTLIALLRGEVEGDPELRLYLVHAPSWPAPRRLAMDLTLTVPTALDPWEWRSHELTEELVGLKLRAIQAYSSQRITSGRFLASFVRQNEVYAVSAASDLPGGPALSR